MRTRSRWLPGLALVALLVAACETDDTTDADAPVEGVDEEDAVGDDTVGNDTVDDEATDAEADPEAVEEDDTPASGEVLSVGQTDVGEHVVDAEGMTVYIHALDQLEDGTPTCTGDCAVVWLPVPADQDDPFVGEGVDQELVGTVDREDGESVGVEQQLTYDGRPLYTFASDQEPGDVRGQELADIWFAIAPDGEPIGEVPDEAELEELDMDEDAA